MLYILLRMIRCAWVDVYLFQFLEMTSDISKPSGYKKKWMFAALAEACLYADVLPTTFSLPLQAFCCLAYIHNGNATPETGFSLVLRAKTLHIWAINIKLQQYYIRKKTLKTYQNPSKYCPSPRVSIFEVLWSVYKTKHSKKTKNKTQPKPTSTAY